MTTLDTTFDRQCSTFHERVFEVAFSARLYYLLRQGLPADVARRHARVSANAAAIKAVAAKAQARAERSKRIAA